MDVYEITGFATGVSDAGVNFLQPSDSFQNITNGFVYRQVLQSRQGVGFFAPRLSGATRIFGIFEHTLPDQTKELLAIDQNRLYKFNAATGVFDPIPFSGALAGYPGFAITSKKFYVSGTSYATATNTARFVFTGEGITPSGNSAIFFYDGTNVKDFTDIGDNPNYAPPLSPVTGVAAILSRAVYVVGFGERLNFFVPTIDGITYNQGILYSGIRTGTGNGDKFNVAGSGFLQADTYEIMTGVTILGQVLSLCFNRSAWTLEKTTDAFNPYFIRRLPSVLGTNAKFSAQSWDEIVKSMGKTGAVQSDGRQSLRFDNKVPRFTEDEIDQTDFGLTYGGFDRKNNQFLWSYKKSESESTTQNSVLVYNYEEDSWSVNDQRFSVYGQSDVGLNLTWDQIDEAAGNKSWKRWDKTEDLWDEIGLGAEVQKTLAGDDLGFIYELNQDYDDFYADISAITSASQAVLTIDASAFLAGDLVVIENVEGMTEINNFDADSEFPNINFVPYTVLVATPTSLTLDVDSSGYGVYVPNTGSVTKVISFRAETIPFNPYRSQGRRCYISHVEFLLDTNGGNLKVDVIEDEYNDTPFKKDIIIFPNQEVPARQWITMTVDNEANFFTFVLKQISPSVQMRLTSMRLHCSPGGLTSG